MAVDTRLIERMTHNEADMAFKKRVLTIFEWLPPHDQDVILDCACGRGFYLNMFRHVSACRLIGLELDEGIIRKAQRNVGHLSNLLLVQGTIYELPFPGNYFDGLILSEILEHVEDDVAALREVRRVLKPRGICVITVPNANYPFFWDPIISTLERLFGTHIASGPVAGIWTNHVRLYRPEQLRAVVETAGLAVEAERAFTHYSFPFIHNLVYGLGKPLFESGLLPARWAQACDRIALDAGSGSCWNPIRWGIKLLNLFDRLNRLEEPPGRSTVNLALKAYKPPE